MTHRTLGVLSAVALTISSSAVAKGPFGSVTVGNWKGGAYTNDVTGQFTGCSAGSPYLSGIYFVVSVGPDGSWGLGFAHNSWQLTPNEAFPIDFTFDGQAQFHVFGSVVNTKLVRVPMPNNSALLAQFRKSKSMTALAKGQLFQFSLDGTSQLLPTLANCVAAVKANGLANAGDFSTKPTPKPVAAPPPVPTPAVGGSLTPDSSPASSADLQIEAIELASNFILKTSLHGAKVLNRAETPVEIAANGAAWRSEEASGFVRIVPVQGNVKGLDVAAAVVGNDAKDCKGKFASGRTSELVDSDVVFRGFASCDDTNGNRMAQYFIVPRRKGGFVMFSIISNMKTEDARNVIKDEKLVDFRKAALVVGGQ